MYSYYSRVSKLFSLFNSFGDRGILGEHLIIFHHPFLLIFYEYGFSFYD